MQNIKHILVVPEYREQRPGRGRTCKGVHCIKERDNIRLSRGSVQRLCICERRTECRGCACGRVEKQKAGRGPAVCWEVVNEHKVIVFNKHARPEVAGLKGATMLCIYDAGVILEGTVCQIREPAESARQRNLEISLAGIGCSGSVGECVVLFECSLCVQIMDKEDRVICERTMLQVTADAVPLTTACQMLK